MKLCVFQGTFNPIHNGHIKMAEYVLENVGFNKILFIPAYKPPHKDYDDKLSYHRFEMVKLAISQYKSFGISDIEFRNERPSYTYLTVLDLYNNFDIDGKINFIIGTDAFKEIDSWYEADKLKKLLKFIVFKRETENEYYVDDCDFTYAKMNLCDISSTQIRNCVKMNKSVANLVPVEVEGYIKKYGIYK